jgi:hypothetical protein
VVVPAGGESVFNYLDTAATKAGIIAANKQLEAGKTGIVGVDGTGVYVLDQVVKTPVPEIHLFDGDVFLNHNAFRSPRWVRSKYARTVGPALGQQATKDLGKVALSVG